MPYLSSTMEAKRHALGVSELVYFVGAPNKLAPIVSHSQKCLYRVVPEVDTNRSYRTNQFVDHRYVVANASHASTIVVDHV
eukprot:5477683-Amphidinium_carterae.1